MYGMDLDLDLDLGIVGMLKARRWLLVCANLTN